MVGRATPMLILTFLLSLSTPYATQHQLVCAIVILGSGRLLQQWPLTGCVPRDVGEDKAAESIDDQPEQQKARKPRISSLRSFRGSIFDF